MSDSELYHYFYTRVPARVLACLNSIEITAIVSAGHGIVEPESIPINWIPHELRMPNSEFDIFIRFPGGKRMRILRKEETCIKIARNHA